MRTRLDTDLETVQREAQLRRIGRDLHNQAAAISSETIDAMAAVVSRLASATDYGELVSEGFGGAILTDAENRHLSKQSVGSTDS